MNGYKTANYPDNCLLIRRNNNYVTALVANSKGDIFELEGYAAVGMAGCSFIPMAVKKTVEMAYGSELMFLPDRWPVLYNLATLQLETIRTNPYSPNERILPVAAFISPGSVLTLNSAYVEKPRAKTLPLFSYCAVGWHHGKFRSASIKIDRERRQDLRLMPPQKVSAGIHRFRKQMPRNRLRQHLENCALTYGCPAAKNFFIGRYEAPLPTSRKCNASCLGCLSLQPETGISHCQERIAFTPTPQEIAEIALTHIKRVKKGIVSFGQGCEGDPLLAAEVIEPALQKIRSVTLDGTINMNTNASRPDLLKKLFAAGLDSIRISMNSVREACYNAYFRPRGYRFSDIVASIDMANQRNKLVYLNYLNCPGFTDSPEEYAAFKAFLQKHPIDLIQWRNLNIDPLQYLKAMNAVAEHSLPLGMTTVISKIRKHFPVTKHGYFNPPKETFKGVSLDCP